MENSTLSSEELELLASFENNEWLAEDNLQESKTRYQHYAEQSLKKD